MKDQAQCQAFATRVEVTAAQLIVISVSTAITALLQSWSLPQDRTLGRARSRASLKCQDSTRKGGVAGASSQSYRTRQGGGTAKNTAEGLTEGWWGIAVGHMHV